MDFALADMEIVVTGRGRAIFADNLSVSEVRPDPS
jgi:hypothetical protein